MTKPIKLSMHHMIGGREAGKLLKLKPTTMIFVGDLGLSIEADLNSTLTIGRIVDDGLMPDKGGFDMNRFWKQGKSPKSMASTYVDLLRDPIKFNPWIQMWTGPNEMVFERDDAKEKQDSAFKAQMDLERSQVMTWYATFLYEFANLLKGLGKRAGLGNWPTGNPIPAHNLWPFYIPALKAVKDFNAVLTRHDYAGFDDNGQLRIVNDNAVFARLGYPNMPVIITECGMDSVANIPNSSAWRTYYKTMDRYWNELLLPFSNAIAVPDYCIGACVFTDGGAGWPNHDISNTDIVDRIQAWALAGPPPPPPPPTPVVTGLHFGVHGRADGRMQPADFQAVAISKSNAVKLLSTAAPEDVDALKAIDPNILIVVRLYSDFSQRIVSPGDFISWVKGDVENFYTKGVRNFEIHNEPNLKAEGNGLSWNGGAQFAIWFESVRSALKRLHPDILLGWPGLSPGPEVAGVRSDDYGFLLDAGPEPMNADWIGEHVYWTSASELDQTPSQINSYVTRFPNKPVFITEYSNPTDTTDKTVKANQYNHFYQLVNQIPAVKAMFAFVVSASSATFESETWRDEKGVLSVIPAIVANRTMAPDPFYTHQVTAKGLNVRQFPWTGVAVPPILNTLKQGDRVKVYGTYQMAGSKSVWGCIAQDGNQWVNEAYISLI